VLVVIFRARLAQPDAGYAVAAARMRELAFAEFGCLGFHAVTEGSEEIALSYWPDEDSIRRWREHPEHRLAQQAGRERWYASWSVQVAQVCREYRVGDA
jgi:heme-degrading monooxygenase HmoA